MQRECLRFTRFKISRRIFTTQKNNPAPLNHILADDHSNEDPNLPSQPASSTADGARGCAQTFVAVASRDLCITKDELIDVDALHRAIRNTGIPEVHRRALKRLKKELRNGNVHPTVYRLCRKTRGDPDLGLIWRLTPVNGVGLQGLPRDLRALLARKFYVDVDCTNSQPAIALQLAAKIELDPVFLKRYVEHREEILRRVSEANHCDRAGAKTRLLSLHFNFYPTADKAIAEIAGDDPTLREFLTGLHFDLQALAVTAIELPEWKPEVSAFCLVGNGRGKSKVYCKNHLGVSLALILQTIERSALLAVDDALMARGYRADVLIHDGLLVAKKTPGSNEEIPADVLAQVSEDAFRSTGYRLRIEQKQLVSGLDGNNTRAIGDFHMVPAGELVTPAYAARRFAELRGAGNVLLDEKALWIYDHETGMWCCDADAHKIIVENMGHELTIRSYSEDPTSPGVVKAFAGAPASIRDLLEMLPAHAHRQDGWAERHVHSDFKKLLFEDGIFDFDSGRLVPFDGKIVFTCRVNRRCPLACDDETKARIAEIRRISFDDMPPESSATLLHELMRGIIGDVRHRTFLVGLGPTSSGKGLLKVLIKSAFRGAVGEFDGNAMLRRRDGNEPAREMDWIIGIAGLRLAFGSEIRTAIPQTLTIQSSEETKILNRPTDCIIDGNNLKRIVSGGTDMLIGRCAYGRLISRINKAMLFLFAQDVPAIRPVDDAVANRMRVCEWKLSYVTNPQLPHERLRDPELLTTYATDEYADAFFWLMVEEFEKWRAAGFVEPTEPRQTSELRNDLLPSVNLREILSGKYEITGDAIDYVAASELFEYLHGQCHVEGSPTKIGRMLSQIQLEPVVRKIGGKPEKVRLGLRRK